MVNSELKHMLEDLEILKKDVAVIKHILSEEGKLTMEEKKLLEESFINEKEGKLISNKNIKGVLKLKGTAKGTKPFLREKADRVDNW